MRTSRRKGRAVQPHQKPRATVSAKCPGGRLVESPRRVTVRSYASNAGPMAVLSQRITPWTAIAMTAMASPSRLQQVSPLSPRSPTRSLEATRIWPSCSPCSRLMQKGRRKPVSLRSVRNVTMTPMTVPIVNRKLGTKFHPVWSTFAPGSLKNNISSVVPYSTLQLVCNSSKKKLILQTLVY